MFVFFAKEDFNKTRRHHHQRVRELDRRDTRWETKLCWFHAEVHFGFCSQNALTVKLDSKSWTSLCVLCVFCDVCPLQCFSTLWSPKELFTITNSEKLFEVFSLIPFRLVLVVSWENSISSRVKSLLANVAADLIWTCPLKTLQRKPFFIALRVVSSGVIFRSTTSHSMHGKTFTICEDGPHYAVFAWALSALANEAGRSGNAWRSSWGQSPQWARAASLARRWSFVRGQSFSIVFLWSVCISKASSKRINDLKNTRILAFLKETQSLKVSIKSLKSSAAHPKTDPKPEETHSEISSKKEIAPSVTPQAKDEKKSAIDGANLKDESVELKVERPKRCVS